MTESDVKKFLTASVPKDRANAEEIASLALSAAISKLGRMPNVDWNRDEVSIQLESGNDEYELNVDILESYPNIWNIEELWHTDSSQKPVKVVGLSEFNAYKRGSSTSGRPILATIHSSNPKLEFYPTPDSNYVLWSYVQKQVDNFNDIPDGYHDVLISVGQEYIRSITDPNMSAKLAEQGINEIEDQSKTKWTGNVIDTSGNIGRKSKGKSGYDSYNLTGG